MADQVTQVQTNIPDYVRPYVESMLGRTHDLVLRDPPPSYGAQRIAGPSPLQQQSYARASGMAPAGQLSTATTMAQGVGTQAGQAAQYTPGSFTPTMTGTGQWGVPAMTQYMSPYQQGVTDIAKREAMRGSDMMGQRDNAQAVGAGAFGGTRHALVQAERERNLGRQMDDIQMQGSNAAYLSGQQAFMADQQRNLQSQMANQGAGLQGMQMGEQSRQFGAGLGIQGLQTQLGAAGMLKDIGTSQYNQNLGIAGLQNQFGTQQQMTNQAGLDHQYQEWQNRINWPYKQLEFQNSMNRGLPMSQSTTSMSTPSPSPLSQMLGAGAMIYGMGQRPTGMAEGGMVGDYDYADGGMVAPMAQMPPTRGAGLADLLISQMGA